MELIKKFRNWIVRHWQIALVCFMATTIPYTINVGNLSIIFAFIISIYLVFKGKVKKKEIQSFAFYFPLLFFLLVLISALLSKDVREGLTSVDKKLLFVLIPVAVFTLCKKGFNLKRVLVAFAGSTVIATGVLLLYAVIKIISGEVLNSIFFHNFSSLFEQHAVYFALYISLSLLVIFHYYIENTFKNPKRITWVVISFFILFVGLILTASKAVIFIFGLLVFFKIIFLRITAKKKILICSSFLLIAIVVANIPIVKQRFIEGLEFNISNFEPQDEISKTKEFSYDEKTNISDLELRYVFFQIGTYHLWHDDKILFGYGVGDVQNHLDYYYLVYNLAPNWFEGFNLHNQYLQILVSLGIFVFLFFIFYLFYSFYYAIKGRNILHLYFLVLITFVFLFECLLDRNKGIVFFVFFNTLFLIDTLKNEDRNNWLPRNTKSSRRF